MAKKFTPLETHRTHDNCENQSCRGNNLDMNIKGQLRKRQNRFLSLTGFTRCEIVYEDEALMVVNKPAGVLSHPNTSVEANSTEGKPAAAFEGSYHFEERQFDTPAGPLWLMHRLDQDASGVILAVKSKELAATVRNLFERNEVSRKYLTLVSGIVIPYKGEWRDRLAEKKKPGQVRGFVMPHGAPNAILNYALKHNFPRQKICLLEIELVTGKTHQIRIQSAHRKHPVCGDRVYGDFKLNRKLKDSVRLKRLFLHACELGLRHPVTKKFLTVEAPLPGDLEDVLKNAAR